jgi:TRAP transporter TAXI family solute receptor
MWAKLKRFDFLLLTPKEMRLLAFIALALIALALWMLFAVISPPPPKVIRISSGSQSGAYYQFAQKYADKFKQHGIELQVLTSNGSVENLARLNDKSQHVDLAFVQGGVADAAANPQLESLASVALEPVWIFYQRKAFAGAASGAAPGNLNHLSDLAGKTIAVGAQGSGVRAVALEFLKLNQITDADAKLLPVGGLDAVAALEAGTVDAIFLVAAIEAPAVQSAMAKDLALYSFNQSEAYTRAFPWAARIILPRGGASMARNLPADDVSLVAATANLVARGDLHRSIMYLALDIASEVHHVPNAFSAVGDFPNKKNLDFKQSEESKRYFETGRPFLQRYVPFWLANLLERFLVLLGPILAIGFPLVKLGPALMNWKESSELAQIYDEVLDIEYGKHEDPASVQKALDRLTDIEASIPHLGLTAHYYTNIFSLRGHLLAARRNIRGRAGLPPEEPRVGHEAYEED